MKYGIISDVHGNYVALTSVLDELKEVDRIICVGDIVGYGPQPNECVRAIRNLGSLVIMGNHDLALIGELSISSFNEYAIAAILWTKEQITSENLEYLKGLSHILDLPDFVVVHGGLRNYTLEYIFDTYEAEENFALLKKKLLIVGHTHYPISFLQSRDGFVYAKKLYGEDVVPLREEGNWIINVGSVGQPRDGDPRSSFAILDTEEKIILIKRVPYDIPSTQRLMREVGLPDFLIQRIERGI
jgi:predicted phosphodiesterase